jgi:hypothetical protein
VTAQLYGTPLGLVLVVGGGIVWALVSRRPKNANADSQRRPGESLSGWWRRRKLGRESYDYWLVSAGFGALLLVASIIGRDLRMIALSLLMTALSVGVLLSRWGGRRPPG